jgi:hypothetical protein
MAPAQISPPTQISVALDRVGCDDSELELVVPFYEGIHLRSPKQALYELGLQQIQLLYPAPLSIPAAAWRCRDGDWSIIGARLDDVPVLFELRRDEERAAIALTCLAPCRLLGWTASGDASALAASFRSVYARSPHRPALGASLSELRFYVHRWIADDDPALRTDWEIEELGQEMAATPESALAFVYGWDPGAVDLGGRSFWSDGAEENVRAVLGQNPKLSHLAWLNLRSFKRGIPRLGLDQPLPAAIDKAAWRGPKGLNVIRQHAFEAVEMCLCTRAWQSSRKLELERLAKLGFRVIQLDEFPVATRWHAEPCLGEGHEHAAGDLAGEWRCTLGFVRELAKRAEALGVMLTSEEPSGALLDLTQGYIDRIANREPDIYGFWTRSAHARPIALFSRAFSGMTTPYTDADPDERAPDGWLRMHKRTH